jgi:hypothetical protein
LPVLPMRPLNETTGAFTQLSAGTVHAGDEIGRYQLVPANVESGYSKDTTLRPYHCLSI